MDVSLAGNVQELDRKLNQGTTATLSEIEMQNNTLQRIESYSQTGMHSSAVSLRSLQSIASSLSRLERLASSTGKASGHRSSDPSGFRADGSHSNHASSEGAGFGSCRLSGGTALSRRSSYASSRASAKTPPIQEEIPSLPSLPPSLPPPLPPPLGPLPPLPPSLPPLLLPGSSPRLTSSIDYGKRQPHLEDSESDFLEIASSHSGQPRNGKVVYRKQSERALEDPSSKERNGSILGHTSAADIWDAQQFWPTLEKQYPESILQYLDLVCTFRAHQAKIDALHLLDLGPRTFRHSTDEIRAQKKEWRITMKSLEEARIAVREARICCILEGHSPYELDLRLRPPTGNDNPHSFWNRHSEPEERRVWSRHLLQRCNGGKSVFGGWTNKCDFINHWMLYNLCLDETQMRLHRFILAEPPRDDEHWAEQVEQSWFVDEVACGDLKKARAPQQ